MGARLRRAGLTVAVVPDEWASAAGGVDIVIGSADRGLGAVSGHRRGGRDRRARRGVAEREQPDLARPRRRRSNAAGGPVCRSSWSHRARRSAPCTGGPSARPPVAREREGWPILDVVDRSEQEPWRRSLLTSTADRPPPRPRPSRRLRAQHDRSGSAPGVSPVSGARPLRALRGCRRPGRSVGVELACGQVRRDAARRVPRVRVVGVCQPAPGRDAAGRGAHRRRRSSGGHGHRCRLRPAARRPALYVGTEAVLHRVATADVVAFLDFDREIAGAALPGRRAGDGAARPRRSVGRAAATGRTDRGADVPPGSRRDPRRAARRSRPARRTRSAQPPDARVAAVPGARGRVRRRERRIRRRPRAAWRSPGATRTTSFGPMTGWTLGQRPARRRRVPDGSRLRIAVDPPDV